MVELHALAHLSAMACPLRWSSKDTCRAEAILFVLARRVQGSRHVTGTTRLMECQVCKLGAILGGLGGGAGQHGDGIECNGASGDGVCS